MYPFKDTHMENKIGNYEDFRSFFQEQDFEVGGDWDYEHGYFDRKLADEPGYLFIRIPVVAVEGSFGEEDSKVRLGEPFLLRHKYQVGLNDYVFVDNSNASFNQFSEPVDPDASIKEKDIQKATPIVQELEQNFAERYND